jgi:RNA polymerase sigma factor (sigma-70 family)
MNDMTERTDVRPTAALPPNETSTSSGDTFEALAEAEGTRLVRACLLLTGERAEAEDLAQEAFARVLERWDRIGGMDSPAGYLYRTAINVHRSRLRHLQRVAGRVFAAPDAYDDASTRDARLDILHAVASLPKPQQEALVLVEWLGYPAVEAAKILGIEPVSVRARIHRARTTLRMTLGDLDA